MCGCTSNKPKRQAPGTAGAARQTQAIEPIDPTRALFAAAMVRTSSWTVLPHSGAPMHKGKNFSSKAAADDYARKTHGVLRAR